MKTRRGVQICKVGSYPLSTGPHTFTRAQFEAAIRNAEGRTAPTIGIGHTDERWAKLDPSQDGDAALGRIENLRLGTDRDTLLGDLVDMPDWFANALPSSFPRRSLEGSCNGDNLVITGVKVLGMKVPAVHTLEDLKSFVSDEGPARVAAGADNDGSQIAVVFDPSSEEENQVNPKLIRKALGLPTDATDKQLRAKAEEVGLVENREQRMQAAAKAIQAAVAEGKFSRDRAPIYIERYERDPAGTTELLRRMVAIPAALIAAGSARGDEPSAESELQRRTRIALGLAPASPRVAAAAPIDQSASPTPVSPAPAKPLGPTSGPMFGAPKVPDRVSDADPKLTRTVNGMVLYGGVPARYSNERDAHELWTADGWLNIAEFTRRGMTPGDSALAIRNTQKFGSADAKKRLSDGLPPSIALGLV